MTMLACPPEDRLLALVGGKLPSATAAELNRHIEACARCASAVAQLSAKAVAPRMSGLQATNLTVPQANDARTSDSDADGTLPPRPPSDPNPPPASEGELNFLSPAQQSEELGRLGPYRVLKVLGRGGMGLVLQAEDPSLGRMCALKVMLPELARSAVMKERFLLEAKAAALIEHDNIVPIYQVGEDRGVPFIAMPFLKGTSLEDWLDKQGNRNSDGTDGKPIAVPQILKLGREMARGLAAAHDRGLIHRDIKPDNIWLDSTAGGRVKILDFGVARKANSDREASPEDKYLTQPGTIVGTPAYMSPEQAQGNRDQIDSRADLFSLGCILYRMCTGRMPFRGNDRMSMLISVAIDDPEPPSQVNKAVPQQLSDLVMKLLAKDRNDRPASANDVVKSIQRIERDLKAPPPEPTLPVTVEPIFGRDETDGSASVETIAARPPSNERKPAAPAAKSPSRRPVRRYRWPMIAVVATTLVAGAIAGALIFRAKPEGLARIEISDPEINAAIDQSDWTMHGTGHYEINLPAGEHVVHVQRGGVEFQSEPIVLHESETISLKIELSQGIVRVVQGDRVIGQMSLPPTPADQVAGPKTSERPAPRRRDDKPVKPTSPPLGAKPHYALQLGPNQKVAIKNLKPPTPETPVTLEAFVTPARDDYSNTLVLGIASYLHLDIHDKHWSLSQIPGTGVNRDRAILRKNHRTHVAGVWTPEESRLYVDGKLAAKGPSFRSKLPPIEHPGGTLGGSDFEGMIEEVRFSSVARYDKEFTPESRFEPDQHTLALFHFEEGSGDTVKDSSAKGFDGKIVGGAKWVKPSGVTTPTLPEKYVNGLGMQFSLVPKGKSWFGGGDGKPGHLQVELRYDFYLGTYELTQEEWENVMGNNLSFFSRSGGGKGQLKGMSAADLKRLPADHVTREEAAAFLVRLNEKEKQAGWVYRLPTPAEWEYACRGGPMKDQSESAFDYYLDKPTNQLLFNQANFGGNQGRTMKVGSYKPNRLGIYDMHGNVSEWCESIAGLFVTRGGSWNDDAGNCKVVRGSAATLKRGLSTHGLRIARVPAGVVPLATILPDDKKTGP
jgi:serine/threonine protein kinase/formylglycine-generating enzyme required for sulfatase activity